MKKVLTSLFTVLALILAGTIVVPSAQAQAGAPMAFYLGAGVSIPTGDLGDGWKMGFHGLGRLGVPLAPKLDLLLGLDYHSFGFDDQGVSGFEGGTLSTINITGDLKVDFGTPNMSANPFLLGGTGLSIWSISDLTFTGPGGGTATFESETDVFIEVGGGVEFNKFFIMGRYVNIFAEGSSISYIPLTAGFKF